MDAQILINTAFGAAALLGGWVLKLTYSQEDYRGLQKYHEEDLRSVRKEMSELALSLPEKYVSKQDLEKLTDFINERFNKLEVKLDQINKS